LGILDFFKKKEADPLGQGMNLDMNAGLPGMPNLDPGLGPEFDQHSGTDLGNFNNPQSMSNQPASNLSNMGFSSQSQGQGFSQASPASQSYASYPAQNNDIQKDLQILSLKLDAIKSQLDAMNQRVNNIERIALKDEQQIPQQRRWY